jgi:excisionase family DNA binding protein
VADDDATRQELVERLAEHVDATLAAAARDGVTEPLIRAEELARRLDVSESLVYRLARDGKIPAYKVGGNWRFSWMEVVDTLRQK